MDAPSAAGRGAGSRYGSSLLGSTDPASLKFLHGVEPLDVVSIVFGWILDHHGDLVRSVVRNRLVVSDAK